MSNIFREYLKKIGSGVHTSKDLTRAEAADAMKMMLLAEATPAQIGAFLMVHRIKRPIPQELAGMLDTYAELGPKLNINNLTFDYPVTVLGTPYDGRSRTAPVTTLTALILATAGVPIILHGGDRMPTKYGLPLITILQGLGVDFSQLSLTDSQQLLEKTGLTFIYLPRHFPLANQLVAYREQIGKRPPLATLELMWAPCSSNQVHIVSGFVHPPTETFFRETFQLRDFANFTTVKGLEGSCDLPQSRTAIIGINQPHREPQWERLHLHPQDYHLGGKDIPLISAAQLIDQMQQILQGTPNDLMDLAIYNGGFYLWRCGVCQDLSTAFTQAKTLLTEGQVAQKLQEISASVTLHRS
ncbi:anthranilate phosphoribosyltransferase family protein [Crocosphaera sp. XPORK-15E]|uniref:anthranilate phosphoribosyltransferase family protein n=1 Tax=Crocosphaera sp. XPORK-15E TaxID=3110247 RepID=UPI002B1FBB70|nr:anthranilate phosphoribosyltransferase family protein [Crocosphaera sp. XPORK-15E]MEA5533203.1 anthranilate phosphoribosyltransferase family protein [Crocosphaera sp. XPORK-15E]